MDLSALVTELRTAVAATWPECATAETGVFEQRQIRNIPFEQFSLPYACIVLGGEEEADWGATNLAFEMEVGLHYIVRDAGEMTTIRTKLQSMLAYFWPTDPLTEAQIIEGPSASSAESLAMNEELRLRNLQAVAGAVRLRVVMGMTVA